MGDNSHMTELLKQLISIRSADEELRASQADAEREAFIRRTAADASATRRLADLECPADLIEWGRSHGIPTFAEVTWCAGFIAGWRAFKTWSDAREMASAHDSMERTDPPC